MNLRDLHTPVPLRESDYAAVRARVIAEMEAQRLRRRWFFALATAAMLLLIVVVRVPEERRRPGGWSAGVPAGARETRTHQPAGGRRSAPPVAVLHVERPTPVKTQRTVPSQPLRIELHTADPDVRIIWIVDPKTREES